MTREQLIQYAIAYDGDWNRISAAIARSEYVSYHPSFDTCITILDKEYPSLFRSLRYPPWVVFYKGNISLLKQPMITMIGSRKLGEYGRRMTERCASELSKKFVLVSGLAKGADGMVHQTAIRNHGHTIGIIGSGLKYSYPYENIWLYQRMAATDLILSEYPYSVPVRKHHFPWRNRLLAALGQCILVTQAELHSGTMLTVNEGIALSKDIWCVPYPLDDEKGAGCNRLISEGANILSDLYLLKDFEPYRSTY